MLNKMKAFIFKNILVAGACSLLWSEAAAVKPADCKPNVVIIFNDDQGYQDFGCFGSPDIKTPRVDQLAKEGMKLTSFYAGAYNCSASRASLLTGCYPYRVGVSSVFFPNTAKYKGLDPKHVTIAEVLKGAGYRTKAVGKWHLGDKPDYLPTNQGFDSYYGIPFSNDMHPIKGMKYGAECTITDPTVFQRMEKVYGEENKRNNPRSLRGLVPLMRDLECIEFPCDQTTITRRYADESIRFIRECAQKDQPFFLYLANSMPHTPLHASPQFKGKSAGGLYGDVVEEIDFNVGRVMDCIQQAGLEENTIVIVSSDNGPWLIKGDDGGHALPLFEGKGTCFEGGQRVPAILKWPKHVPAGSVCDEVALSMDLLPTLVKITGAEFAPYMPIDGVNILDLITGKAGAKTPHQYFFYHHNAVRSGDWKYHKEEIFRVQRTKRETSGPTLYNLKDDIGEAHNVIAQHPEIAARLSKQLEAHIEQTPVPPKK